MTVGSFAYSFDRETFKSDQSTRQDAFKAGVSEGKTHDAPPETVYVGKRVPIDPGSAGLAEMVLGAMRRRVKESLGEDAAEDKNYLLRVNEHQLAELDDELDRVIRTWLTKHNLQPTQSKITAISEHPMPQAVGVMKSSTQREVGELGSYPITFE